jgi:hypothetical protein
MTGLLGLRRVDFTRFAVGAAQPAVKLRNATNRVFCTTKSPSWQWPKQNGAQAAGWLARREKAAGIRANETQQRF